MDICLQLTELVKLLDSEEAQARSQGFSTVTLTQEEVKKISDALVTANRKILRTSRELAN